MRYWQGPATAAVDFEMILGQKTKAFLASYSGKTPKLHRVTETPCVPYIFHDGVDAHLLK